MRTKVQIFVKQHAHLFVLSGAFIVFMTFVVKEGLREQWKETADGIDTAQRQYRLRDELINLGHKIDNVEDNMSKTPPDDPLKRWSEVETGPGSYFYYMEEWRDHLDSDTENYQPLIDVLPKNSGFRKSTQGLRDGIKQFDEQLGAMRGRLLKYAFDKGGIYPLAGQSLVVRQEIKRRVEEVDKEHEKIRSLESENEDLFYALKGKDEDLKDTLSTYAENIRHTNYRRSRYAWWISAFLFAFGWGLSLVGKLYGVPESGAGE